MPKTPAPNELNPAELAAELHVTALSAFGSMFEAGEQVSIRTHSGGLFEGEVEDSNLAGVLVRTQAGNGDRLFFVSFSGIEFAEIFEADEDGGGDAIDANAEEKPAADAPAEEPRSAA